MTNIFKQHFLLWIFSLFLLAAIVMLASARVREFEERIQTMELQQEELVSKVRQREGENAELAIRLAETEEELKRLYQPQPVGSPAQFPVARVLARDKDTVESLARREGTIPEVIQALNPWLGDSQDLIEKQAIWVPVP